MVHISTELDSSRERKAIALEVYQKFIFIAKFVFAQNDFSPNTLYHVIEQHL